LQVDRGGGKGWELGTVVKLAEISDADRAADQAHIEAAAAAAAARAAAVAAEALAKSAASAGQMINDGVSKFTGSSRASNETKSSSGKDNDSSDSKLSKVYAAAKDSGLLAKLRAKADRADRRAARKERDAARQARARAKRRVRRALPSVQLDGWKTASTYRQMRRVAQASQRLAAGESEAKVAAWAPQPLDVLLVPDYPGTPAGYLLYPGQTFVYKRRIVLRYSNVIGHGGREFQMAFYELADGTGWVHDFCNTNPEGRAIEEMGSGSGARDSVLGALQGWVGDALAVVPFSGQARHDATAVVGAEEQAKKAKEMEARRRKQRRLAAAQPVPNADDDPHVLRAQLKAKAADKAARLSHQSTASPLTIGSKATNKKAGKLPPQYLAKLEAVKAQYGQAKYDELIWWKDKGTLAHQDKQATLDAAEVASLQAANEARRTAAVSLHGWFGVEVSASEKQAALHKAAEAKIKAQSAAAVVASQVAARATVVSFDPIVRVLHVPSWRILRPHARVALWTPSQELKAAKKRNLVEYEFESFDWTKVVGDEQFVVHGGEKLHPVHLFAERLHQQTVAELRLLDDEVRELHQFKRMVRELVVEPAYANHLASTAASTTTPEEEEKDATQGNGNNESKAKRANKAKSKAAPAKTALTEMPLDYWQGRYASVGDPHLSGADPFDRARAQREARRVRDDALNRLKAPQEPWGAGREAMISGEEANDSLESEETGTAGSVSRGRSLKAASSRKESKKEKKQQRNTSSGGNGDEGSEDDDDGDDDESVDDEVEVDYGPDAPTDDLSVESSLLGDGGPETRARLKLRGSSVKAFKGKESSDDDGDDDEDRDGFPLNGGVDDDDESANDDAALVELAMMNGDVSASLSVAESARAKAAAKQVKLEARNQEEARRVERQRRREEATRAAGKPLRLGQRLRDESTTTTTHDSGGQKHHSQSSAPSSGRLETGLDKAKLDMIKLGLVNGGSHVPVSKLYDDANRLRRDHTKERLKILRELSELRGLVSVLTKTDEVEADDDSDSADASVSKAV